jgi:hypothetical protein
MSATDQHLPSQTCYFVLFLWSCVVSVSHEVDQNSHNAARSNLRSQSQIRITKRSMLPDGAHNPKVGGSISAELNSECRRRRRNPRSQETINSTGGTREEGSA